MEGLCAVDVMRYVIWLGEEGAHEDEFEAAIALVGELIRREGYTVSKSALNEAVKGAKEFIDG